MFEVRRTSSNVQGESVNGYSRMVREEDISFLAEAGSTGLFGEEGRDSRSRSYVGLVCEAPDVFFDPVWNREGKTVGVLISGCGDSVLEALVAALEFVLTTLRDARSGKVD